MSETELSFLSPGSLEEPLIFESLILEFRWRNSERSTAPKTVKAIANAKAEHESEPLEPGPTMTAKIELCVIRQNL